VGLEISVRITAVLGTFLVITVFLGRSTKILGSFMMITGDFS
jgi:hypothetical protein